MQDCHNLMFNSRTKTYGSISCDDTTEVGAGRTGTAPGNTPSLAHPAKKKVSGTTHNSRVMTQKPDIGHLLGTKQRELHIGYTIICII